MTSFRIAARCREEVVHGSAQLERVLKHFWRIGSRPGKEKLATSARFRVTLTAEQCGQGLDSMSIYPQGVFD